MCNQGANKELRREGGKSLLADVKGVGPYQGADIITYLQLCGEVRNTTGSG